MDEEDASKLIGGRLYLHEAKASPSYFGGKVLGYRVEHIDQAHSKRIVFNLRSEREGKGVAWEGDDHAMAWSSGVVG